MIVSSLDWFAHGIVPATLVSLLIRNFAPSGTISKIRDAASAIAVAFVLPFHIYLSIVRPGGFDTFENYAKVGLSGIVVCSTIIIVGKLFFDIPRFRERYHPHFMYAAGTFGGGTRAMFFLGITAPFIPHITVLDMSVFATDPNLAINLLAVFDLGYWLFFNSIIATVFMPRSFPNVAQGETRCKDDTLGKILKYAPIITFVLAVFGFTGELFGKNLSIASHVDVSWIELSRSYLGNLLVFLATIAMILGFERKSVFSATMDVFFILLVRWIPIAVIAVLLFYLNKPLLVLLVVPVFLMAVTPPSSLVASMLHTKGASPEQEKQIHTVVGVWNTFFFFGTVLLAAVIGVFAR